MISDQGVSFGLRITRSSEGLRLDREGRPSPPLKVSPKNLAKNFRLEYNLQPWMQILTSKKK